MQRTPEAQPQMSTNLKPIVIVKSHGLSWYLLGYSLGRGLTSTALLAAFVSFLHFTGKLAPCSPNQSPD